MSDGTTNNQIVDSVTTTNLLVGGQAPSQSFGMLDTVMAETLGMAMHNAVMRQQASGTVNAAAVTAACARMLQVPTQLGEAPATHVQPLPPTPPGIQPIPPTPQSPPSPPPSSNGIGEALARAKAAINVILNGTAAGTQEEAEGLKALATLNLATAPPANATPSTPSTPAQPNANAPTHP